MSGARFTISSVIETTLVSNSGQEFGAAKLTLQPVSLHPEDEICREGKEGEKEREVEVAGRWAPQPHKREVPKRAKIIKRILNSFKCVRGTAQNGRERDHSMTDPRAQNTITIVKQAPGSCLSPKL